MFLLNSQTVWSHLVLRAQHGGSHTGELHSILWDRFIFGLIWFWHVTIFLLWLFAIHKYIYLHILHIYIYYIYLCMGMVPVAKPPASQYEWLRPKVPRPWLRPDPSQHKWPNETIGKGCKMQRSIIQDLQIWFVWHGNQSIQAIGGC